MARERYSNEEILQLLGEIELSLESASDVATACRTAGISDVTYYAGRQRFGGMGDLKALQKQNDRLKNFVSELKLNKLILKENLSCFKPEAGRQTSFVSPRFIPDKSW